MESTTSVSKLEISINKIFYDKKAKILSIDNILGYTFVGHYKKSTKVKDILDDIHISLRETQIERKDIYFLDLNNVIISEETKLKDVIEKKETLISDLKDKTRAIEVSEKRLELDEDKKKEKQKKRKKESPKKHVSELSKPSMEEEAEEFLEDSEVDMLKAEPKASEDYRGSPPGGAPESGMGGGKDEPIEPVRRDLAPHATVPQPTTYNINMGFQYYSVMMMQKSYLFYVFFSHGELKIMDEEGKAIYTTTLEITTTKKEPPKLNIRIEGEGFEVHPLTGTVVVKKDSVNPPVMIFSVLPIKSGKKKKLKVKNEKRTLYIYVDFENRTISNTALSIWVQPKHYHLKIGFVELDISKRTAFLISFLSALIATISTIYSAITLESISLVDIFSGFFPGLAMYIFFSVFIIVLIKNGIYPVVQKWNALLNFDKGTMMMK